MGQKTPKTIILQKELNDLILPICEIFAYVMLRLFYAKPTTTTFDWDTLLKIENALYW